MQAVLDAARAQQSADQAHLEQIVAGPQDEEVQAAQDVVDQAVQQLAVTRQPSTQSEIAGQQALVEQARQQLLKAQQPYTDFDIQQQEHAVAQAEAFLHARANPFTEQDVALAQAQVDQAQAAVQQAELSLQQTRITAPVDGIVLDRAVTPGTVVGPQSIVLTLTPPTVEVDASVDDSQLDSIRVGQSAQMQLSGYPGQTFTGTVSAIAPAVDAKTRTATVRVLPIHTAGVKLYPGMQATVTIASIKSDALVVPRGALVGAAVPGGEGTILTLVDNHADRKSVRLGEINDQMAEVAIGVSEGELVAVANASSLNTGDAVVAVTQTAGVTNAN